MVKIDSTNGTHMLDPVARAIQLENLSGTGSEIAAAFVGTISVVTDKPSWNSKELAIKFGRNVVGQIDETLKAVPGLDWVRLSLATVDGLDFSSEETRSGLIELRDAGSFTKETVDGLLALGVEEIPLWQKPTLNLESAPTVSECETALTLIEWDEWWKQQNSETIPVMRAAGKSPAEIVAALQESL